MRDSLNPSGDDEREAMADESAPRETTPTDPHRTAKIAAGTIAGAVGGVAAGLNTMIVGPVGAVYGALIGLELAELGGQAVAGELEAAYTSEYDEHYRSLWESDAARQADMPFERARPAYRFGHVAAYQPAFVGRDFVAAEPSLRELWERDFQARHGQWDSVRRHVCDAYGHSRSENLGIRRDRDVIGTGGSAVDPLELARARSGLASRPDSPEGDDPLFPTDLAATAPNEPGAPAGERIGEGSELGADSIYTKGRVKENRVW